MEPDDLLCYCFHVTHRKVMNFARIHRPEVPSQLSECGGAGTGCGWCVPFLRQCFDAVQQESSPEIQISAEEYAARRAAYLQDGRTRGSSDSDEMDSDSDEMDSDEMDSNG